MFSLKENFKFLDDGIDVPFYNDSPKLSVFDWGIMLASVILMIGYITVIPITNEYLPLAIFLTGTIPVLYICKGNYGLFFKKLRLNDIKLIILCVIAAIFIIIMQEYPNFCKVGDELQVGLYYCKYFFLVLII